jgi:hypothetical protein
MLALFSKQIVDTKREKPQMMLRAPCDFPYFVSKSHLKCPLTVNVQLDTKCGTNRDAGCADPYLRRFVDHQSTVPSIRKLIANPIGTEEGTVSVAGPNCCVCQQYPMIGSTRKRFYPLTFGIVSRPPTRSTSAIG